MAQQGPENPIHLAVKQKALSPDSARALEAIGVDRQLQGEANRGAEVYKGKRVALTLVLGDDSISMAARPSHAYFESQGQEKVKGVFGAFSRVFEKGGLKGPMTKAEAFVLGHNAYIDALKGDDRAGEYLAQTVLLNRGPVLPEDSKLTEHHGLFLPLQHAVKLVTGKNYKAEGNTPLYDRSAEVLARQIVEAEKHLDEMRDVRTITLIASDGQDAGSYIGAEAVASIVTDMRNSKKIFHIVAAMSMDESNATKRVFLSMGIPEEWILYPGSQPDKIRSIFGLGGDFTRATNQVLKATPAQLKELGTGGFKALGSGK